MCKTAHMTGVRILSIALEEELKVLEVVLLDCFFLNEFSHFSDCIYSLTKVFVQTKGGQRTWGEGCYFGKAP